MENGKWKMENGKWKMAWHTVVMPPTTPSWTLCHALHDKAAAVEPQPAAAR